MEGLKKKPEQKTRGGFFEHLWQWLTFTQRNIAPQELLKKQERRIYEEIFSHCSHTTIPLWN